MKRMVLTTLAALALLCALQAFALLRAPKAHYPARMLLTLAPGQQIVLGRRELAAPQAAQRQLALRRAPDGSWWLRNLQPERALLLRRGGVDTRTGRTVLRAGQHLRIGPAQYQVIQADNATLTLTGAGQRWHYDGARLQRNGQLQPPCPGAGVGAHLQAHWNRWAPRFAAAPRPLAFGGNLHCGARIGIAYTEPGAALVRPQDGDMALTATLPILIDNADPHAAELPLAGIEAIGIGRTRLRVELTGGVVTLLPQGDVSLLTDSGAILPAGVAWEWTQRALWHLPGQSGAILLTLACAALLAARRHPGALGAALFLAGLGAMLLQRAGTPPGIGCSMLLGWAALWCWALLPRRLGAAGCAAIVLLAVGLLVQLELGLGAPAAHWTRYFQKTCALLAIGLGGGSLLRLCGPLLPERRQVEWLLGAAALAALCALGLQVLLGDETGVFNLQPVEFAKFVLAAVSAHCLAVGLGWRAGMPEAYSRARRWLRLGAPVLLLAALFGCALVQVNDFSPLLLLLVWCAAMLLAWATVTGRVVLAGALVAFCVIVATGIQSLHGAGPGELAQSGFYADRFAVWRDPASHPHTGQQMLLAGRAIAEGAWLGTDGLLGLSSLGRAAGTALAIPAVQDDFAPAFFLNRHGLLGAIGLWLLQVAFIAGLVHSAAGAWRRAAAARDFRLAWLGRFQCCLLCGGAAFVGGHLLLSWGTNLAILPIMGQPMSFLSAGGSHLLFFICPLLAVDAMSGAQHAPPQPPTSHTTTAGRGPQHRRVDHAGLCTT